MANNVTDLGKVGMTLKGEYNSAATYERLDVVTYQGSSYVLIVESATNKVPTDTSYWQEIASKGDTGATGATGTSVSSVVLNADYTLTINFSDGTSTTTTSIRGEQGATGNGITSVTKTGTSGLVDTYTITFTNGNTTTFEITNGKTPIKGTDYFTDTEITEFTNTITTNVTNNIGIVVDGINGEVI